MALKWHFSIKKWEKVTKELQNLRKIDKYYRGIKQNLVNQIKLHSLKLARDKELKEIEKFI